MVQVREEKALFSICKRKFNLLQAHRVSGTRWPCHDRERTGWVTGHGPSSLTGSSSALGRRGWWGVCPASSSARLLGKAAGRCPAPTRHCQPWNQWPALGQALLVGAGQAGEVQPPAEVSGGGCGRCCSAAEAETHRSARGSSLSPEPRWDAAHGKNEAVSLVSR